MKTTAPYGSWRSPISAAMVASAGTGSSSMPREIHIDGGTVYWLELRADEGGRYVIMRLEPGGEPEVVTPEGMNVGSRVHEYGGGSYLVYKGTIYFSNSKDQRMYRHDPGEKPSPVTPEPEQPSSLRYADGRISPDGRWLVCVRESHSNEESVINELIRIPVDGISEPHVIASGRDFYANPRFNPEGNQLSWLTWDLPRMPWEGTLLYCGDFQPDGTISNPIHLAGAEGESIFQPDWSPDGALHFVSDRSGWWNHYTLQDGRVSPLFSMNADFGGPQWQFEYSTFAFFSNGDLACTYIQEGLYHFGIYSHANNKFTQIETGFTSFLQPTIQVDDRDRVWLIAGSFTQEPHLAKYELDSNKTISIHSKGDQEIEDKGFSTPKHFEFPSLDDLTAFGFFYPPVNPSFDGPKYEKPPLIVFIHGGPTASARPHLQLEIQFWTSRGFGVADINYSGSTGYGKAYRERLAGRWGEIDVADCAYAAQYLAKQGYVNPERMVIRGGSAGGYVAMLALALYDTFSTGAIYYGVSDTEVFKDITHKFEAGYDDWLLGPYEGNEELYRNRSPVHQLDKLNRGMIFFQGLDDKVVPPSQTEKMVAALAEKGLPYAYLTFEGEGHGFRGSKTIQQSLEAELYFYSVLLGIPVDSSIVPVEIHNMEFENR